MVDQTAVERGEHSGGTSRAGAPAASLAQGVRHGELVKARTLAPILGGMLAFGCAEAPPQGLDLGDATAWPAPPTEAATATIRIHYPGAASGELTLQHEGASAPLPCVGRDRELDVCEVALTRFPTGEKTVAVRPYLGEAPARGPRYLVERDETIEIYPHFVATRGELITLIPDFHSEVLEPLEPGNQRSIQAYLPASYAENTTARYPVVYMHDGRNLFDAASSITGVEWEVDEAAELAWEQTGAFAELIVIAIDQYVTVDGVLQNRRQGEYNPTPTTLSWPQAGEEYAAMVATELKPEVDALLRTLPGREHTATLGSSLGGTISTWITHRYPEVFGRCAALSTASAVDLRWLASEVRAGSDGPRLSQIYLDAGSGEGEVFKPLAIAYRELDYVDGINLTTSYELGGGHTERDWARRLPSALGALFPSRRIQ